ncbi:hypothetical protein [Streptomyces sp. NPDC050704]|uniref:hypothetical protein n=1 Tax=Streptomyces sp. NPDC050704 TaxID=3157219 RepID=UPI0034249770
MPRNSDQHPDPATASVSLAAEAALLEARLRMLQEALDTVDARIEAVSETLRQLRRATPPGAGEQEDCGGSSGETTSLLTPTAHPRSG